MTEEPPFSRRSVLQEDGRGFSVVEVVVVAGLVALLLIIAGQLFVEMARRQAEFGNVLSSTAGTLPYDTILVRDVHEAQQHLPSFSSSCGDFTESDKVLILRLPPDSDGTGKVAVYEAGEMMGLRRTVCRDNDTKSSRDLNPGAAVRFLFVPFLSQMEIRVYPSWNNDPALRLPPRVRVATFRNPV